MSDPAAPRTARLWAISLALLGALALVQVGRQATTEAARWTPEYCATCTLAASGEALIHGVDLDTPSWSMPAYSIANALLCGPAAQPVRALALAVALLACASLVYGLGRLLISPRGGLAAAILYVLCEAGWPLQDRWLFAPTVLLVAFVMVWRARAPSPRRSLALGAAIGVSVLVLSPLFLLPPALLVVEWAGALRARRLSARGCLTDLAALGLVPLLLLLPWALLNLQMHGRLVFLEDGRADLHVATAALGIVHTVPLGDGHALSGTEPGQSVALWAVREVLTHPGRYALAVFERARYVASLEPLLLLAGVLGLALGLVRRRPGWSSLALLVGYWFGLHCLISTEARYFTAFWPLLVAPAASLVPGLRGAHEPGEGRWIPALLAGSFGLLGALQLYVEVQVATYPARAREQWTLDREVAADPGCPWPLSRRGRDRLERGRAAEAVDDLARAATLTGAQRDPTLDLLLAWALLVSDAPWSRIEPLLPTEGYGVAAEQHLVRAFRGLLRDRPDEARAELTRASEVHTRDVLGEPSLTEPAQRERVATTEGSLHQQTRWALACWPLERRVTLLAGLGELVAADPSLFPGARWVRDTGVALADAATRAGESAMAARVERVVERLPAPGAPAPRP